MALFRRRKHDGPDWITDLPDASRASRMFYQALIRRYLGVMKQYSSAGSLVQGGAWDGVRTLAQLHDVTVKHAARDVRGVDIMSPEVQAGLRIGLDQFAEYYGVRGSLVRAWGLATAFNERFESEWQPSKPHRFWWAEQTVAFACVIHPSKEGEPVVDGLLLFDHVAYVFTPDCEPQEQVRWSRRQVRDADEPTRGATVLHLDPTIGYSQADIASKAWIGRETPAGPVFTDPNQPLRRSKPRRNWGSSG